MQANFTDLCTGFFQSALLPLAQYVLSNVDTLAETTAEDLARQMATAVSLPEVAARPTVGRLPVQAPSFAGGAMPLSHGFPGLGSAVAAPPAGTGTSGAAKGRKKTTKPHQPWLTIEETKARLAAGERLCTYNPPRGDNKEQCCGCAELTPETNAQEDPLVWRCPSCVQKKGKFGDKYGDGNTATKAPKAVAGFQAPKGSTPPQVAGVPIPRRTMPLAAPKSASIFPFAAGIPAAPKQGVVEPPTINLRELPGITDYVFGVDGGIESFVFSKDGSKCVGKYDGTLPDDDDPAPDNYAEFIIPLDDDDVEVLSKFKIPFKPLEKKRSKPTTRSSSKPTDDGEPADDEAVAAPKVSRGVIPAVPPRRTAAPLGIIGAKPPLAVISSRKPRSGTPPPEDDAE
jgi:hypothetical protein